MQTLQSPVSPLPFLIPTPCAASVNMWSQMSTLGLRRRLIVTWCVHHPSRRPLKDEVSERTVLLMEKNGREKDADQILKKRVGGTENSPHPQTNTHTHTHTHSRTHTHARTHARTHTHPHTHAQRERERERELRRNLN